jgi:hypothetical protein
LPAYYQGRPVFKTALIKPVFLSDLSISDLTFNNENLGQGKLKQNGIIHLKRYPFSLKPLRVKTDSLKRKELISPTMGKWILTLIWIKSESQQLNLFFLNLISQLRGMASGKSYYDRNLEIPYYSMVISMFRRIHYLVDYLMTRYYFTNDLKIVNNNIVFKDFEIS